MTFNEFEIIEKYFTHLFFGADAVVQAAGDDCAIIDVPPNAELCISTDTLIEGVHFPVGATGRVVAHRSLAANVSDLAAMGAAPSACVLALTLLKVDDAWLKDFSDTLGVCTRKWEIPLVGGNLARGKELSLTFSVMGTVSRGKALRRSGARPGDSVYVTGCPGEAGAGLVLLQRDPVATGALVDRYYYPEPRVGLGRHLCGIANAAIDISDGLVADLEHLAKAGSVNAVINADKLPLSDQLIEAVGRDHARALALSSGDDYELCFTAPENAGPGLSELEAASGIAITRVGSVAPGTGEVTVVDEAGEILEISSRGYRHF